MNNSIFAVDVVVNEIGETRDKIKRIELLIASPFLSKQEKIILQALTAKLLEHSTAMLLLYKHSEPFDMDEIRKNVL